MAKGKTKPVHESFYSKFVENENDVVGLLSYALYQKAWHQHKETLRNKYPDGAVPENEYRTYQAMFEGQIPAHKKIAEEILNKRYENFAIMVHEKINALEENVKFIHDYSTHLPDIRDQVNKRVGFFGRPFWQNVVASAAFPILLGLLILLYKIGSDAKMWPDNFSWGSSQGTESKLSKDTIPPH
ncbi:MAG: hypothetical protein R2791_18740 [Saprospiraceae bacterium]